MRTYPYVDLKEREVGDDAYAKIRDEYISRKPCPTCEGDRTYLAPAPARPPELAREGVEIRCDCAEQLARYKHYLAAGIGELFMRLTWDDYVGDETALVLSKQWLDAVDAMLREGLGISYRGPFGSGKTMLAMLIAKDLVRRGVDVYATTYSQMIETFAAGWRDVDEQRWFERRVLDSSVLVLDDIGKEMGSKVSASTFDHVMRARAVALRSTILTTNLDQQAIDARYGGGALSILLERSLQVVVPSRAGADYRSLAQQRAVHEAARGWRRPIS